jgi:hypothetical protein
MMQYRTINLPEDLCAAAEKSLAGQFDSFEALLGFLLREVVQDDAGTLDRAEQEIVNQRLKDLGYL